MCGRGSGRGNARKLSAVVALNSQWVMCAVMTPKDVFHNTETATNRERIPFSL